MMAVSCSKSDLQPSPGPVRNDTPVQVSLTAAPLDVPFTATTLASKTATGASRQDAITIEYGNAATKSATALTSDEEQKVHDLWVIQFDKASGALVGQPYYADAGQIAQNGTAVSFEARLTSAATQQKVYFVANTHSPSVFHTGNCGTVADLERVCRRLTEEYKPTAAGGLPMLAVQDYPAIVSGTPLTGATLCRLVAKVVLRCRVSPDFAGFTLAGVRLRNVPTAIWYATEKSGVDFPAKVTTYGSESHFDYPAEDFSEAVEQGGYMTLTWYVPENLRKAVTAVSAERERTPDKTDGMATYIEIWGDFKSPVKCERLAYRLLLGDVQNDVNDYNVRRNYVYTATVTLEGRNADDNRLTVESFDMSNSAMLLPAATAGVARDSVTFDIRKLTNGWQTTLPALGSNAALRAEILWTDNASLATQLSVGLDKVNGLLKVKSTGTAVGNAVVALYNNATGGGEILWSWHIWVSGYRPDGSRSYGLGANSRADVTGGQVHTYGSNYMSKNSGKVIMDRNLGATKAYYKAPVAGDAASVQAYGLLYQWGRKDPFTGGTEGTSVRPDAETAIPYPIYGPTGAKLDDEVVDAAGNGIRRINITSIIGSSANTLAYAVKNPLVFIYNSDLTSKGDWYTPEIAKQNGALWGDGGQKSAFDPCPKGWRVPPDGTWNDFTRTSATDGNFLYWEQGVQSEAAEFYLTNGRLYIPAGGSPMAWYPTSGYRDFGRPNVGGKLRFIGKEGFSWSSTFENGCGIFMGYANNALIIKSPDGEGRCANGLGVRCIQE